MSDTEQEIAAGLTPDAELPPDDEAHVAEPDTLKHPEGEPVAPVAAAKSEADIERIAKALQKQAEAHARKVEAIMGDDFAMLVPSPIDWTPGFIFAAEGMLPGPDAVAALDAILGRVGAADYQEATDAQPCTTCNALGLVLTGSRVPGQETKPCGTCNGSGWTHKPVAVPPPPHQVGDFGGGFSVAAPPNAVQVADRWGRPFGHPHYGLEPASVGS